MNRTKLLRVLAAAGGVEVHQARRILDRLQHEIGTAMREGERFDLFGFGVWTSRVTTPQTMNTYRRGTIQVGPRVVVRFRCSAALKRFVNKGDIAEQRRNPSPAAAAQTPKIEQQTNLFEP